MKFLLSLLIAFSMAFASNDGLTIELEPIMVTGTTEYSGTGFKYNESKFLSKTDKKTRELVIQQTAAGFDNPIVNGMQGDRLFLTVDGIKFYNSIYRSGPNQYFSWIPKEFTRDITLNTSDVILGYGNIDKQLGIDKSYAKFSYDSFNNGKNIAVTKKFDKSTIGVNYITTNNIHDTYGEALHTAYNQKSFFVSNNSEVFGMSKILFSQSDKIDRTDKFLQNKPLTYDIQQYGLIENTNMISDYVYTLSLQWNREKINDVGSNKYSNIIDKQTGIDVSRTFLSDRFLLGANNYTEFVTYNNDKKTLQTNFRNFRVMTNSIYSKIQLLNTGDFKSNVKLSYNKQVILGQTLDNKSFENLNYIVDAKYKNVVLSYEKATRNPTLNDLAFDLTSFSGSNVPNPSLKPETFREYKVNILLPFNTEISAYYDIVTDYMVSNSVTKMKENIGASLWGYSLRSSQKVGELKLDGFMQIQRGRTDKDFIDKLTPLYGTLRAEYRNFYSEFLYGHKVTQMSASDKTDTRIIDHNYGYNILNAGYKYEITKEGEVELKLYNLTNAAGRTYGSSMDFYGRSFGLSYTQKF